MPEYWFVSVPGEGNRTVTFQNFKAKIASSQNDLAEVAPLPIPEFKVPSLGPFFLDASLSFLPSALVFLKSLRLGVVVWIRVVPAVILSACFCNPIFSDWRGMAQLNECVTPGKN